ncbi:MAG: SDR family NAD(P)-dependent oxidoreductase, partial [Acidimicrobiales bacterium]
PHLVALGAAAVAGCIEVVFSGGARYLWRLNWERQQAPGRSTERALIFGAGEGGAQIVRALLAGRDSPYLPVALLDDDPAQRSRRIRHLKVVGGREALVSAARSKGAGTVIIAIPSAPAKLVQEITELATDADLDVRVLPSVRELIRSTVSMADIRPVTDADLLGRRVIEIDLSSIAGYLTGSRVLVTGAGGSIGSELCRQVHAFGPATLVMLDRDESALHQVQLSIEGSALLDTRALVVCDIRDRAALDAVFDEHRPHVVFHAAALKHLPLLEMWPQEAVKTNVYGTANVLDVARRYGARRFVNISTDKAAFPTSVLGYSKRLAEGLTADAGRDADGTFLSVRFGNVLGSRGSAISAFRVQVDAGGPITVTDPDVTRYFMTVEEAVRLVVQA